MLMNEMTSKVFQKDARQELGDSKPASSADESLLREAELPLAP